MYVDGIPNPVFKVSCCAEFKDRHTTNIMSVAHGFSVRGGCHLRDRTSKTVADLLHRPETHRLEMALMSQLEMDSDWTTLPSTLVAPGHERFQ